MHFLWFLSLLFSSGVSESSTKLTVEFGQKVTLNCSFADKVIHWFIQRQSEPPVYILRSVDGTSDHSVFNLQKQMEFRRKYSLQTFRRLVIHNVTGTELGSYYCARVKDHFTFSNGTTLMMEEDHHSSSNVTRIDPWQPQQRPQDYLKSWMFFTVVSCLLNCIFIILLSVAVKKWSTLEKKSTTAEPPHDSDTLFYSAIVLPTPPRASQPRNTTSIYTEIQLPASDLTDTAC
ncbi:hypothetical protein AALO_G00287140 [Alosa alosa]|uniref:Immunoglobulin domain-containing protein n=1 Tax=Alosa alosa TaxID=278164 RepID=A0AAV6FKT2_9TELE|nr:hypothetical protein AALO_G00287140 [Alosa alosa]